MTDMTRDQSLMAVALIFSERSTCARAHVGAVIAREGRIITTGYNGAPSGMAHCQHSAADLARTDIPSCVSAVHAEANAIAYAARYGISTDGCDLFTTLSPCMDCSKLIINAGVRRVVFLTMYRDMRPLSFLTVAGIQVTQR